ncbi:MAG: helix-turn-helix transcriptional regulator [Anaerolineaceae bacterium]|nr:helix-turn-helix transcriptional regulator [Anaerolineaceae bacterium]MBN2676752.1 helix-turn-helix transcriptional regulator [Anaerolineaceae bacterium]
MSKRLSLNEVSALLNVTPNRIKQYESGNQIPSLPELEVLSIQLNIPISALLSNDEDPVEIAPMKPQQAKKIIILRQRIIATCIKKALDDAAIPRVDVANALGIKPKELTSYLNGKKPIPLTTLETLCRIASLALQSLFGTHGLVGEKLSQAERVAGFRQLDPELQDFIAQPINRPYVELANRLSKLPADKLRNIAEGLLDITF